MSPSPASRLAAGRTPDEKADEPPPRSCATAGEGPGTGGLRWSATRAWVWVWTRRAR